MSQFKYAVVLFSDNSSSVIPKSWISDCETNCKAPLFLVSKEIKKGGPPGSDFDDCEITILKKFDDYLAARRFDKKSEENSNLVSTDLEIPRRKKRRTTVDFRRNITQVTDSQVEFEQQDLNQPNNPVSVSQSPVIVTLADTVTREEFEAFKTVLFQKLEEILFYCKDTNRNFNRDNLNNADTHSEIPHFPVSTIEELALLDTWIKETQENRIKLVQVLCRVGGYTYAEATRNVLQKLFQHDVALLYRDTSVSGKLAFGELELKSVVIEAVLKVFPDTSEKLIQSKIGSWFRCAPDRQGGRKRRSRVTELGIADQYVNLEA